MLINCLSILRDSAGGRQNSLRSEDLAARKGPAGQCAPVARDYLHLPAGGGPFDIGNPQVCRLKPARKGKGAELQHSKLGDAQKNRVLKAKRPRECEMFFSTFAATDVKVLILFLRFWFFFFNFLIHM